MVWSIQCLYGKRGAGTYFNATAPGNYIAYSVPAVKSAKCGIKVRIQTKANKGIFQLSLSGVNQGQPLDRYNPSIMCSAVDLGTVNFGSGNQPFNFSVTRKNVSSAGYTMAFD